jgi:hypothetical protein
VRERCSGTYLSDLDLERRVRAQLPHPRGVRLPGGADRRLAGGGVVGERHRDRLASLAAPAALLGDQQERVAEQAAQPEQRLHDLVAGGLKIRDS